MNKLRSIVTKEIKELIRDPKILFGVILMPILIFPAMGAAIRVGQSSAEQAISMASFAIYNDDSGIVTDVMVDWLYRNNTVFPIEAASIEDAIRIFQTTDNSALVYIPEEYNDNITHGERGVIKVYANLRKLNMAETQSTDKISYIINSFSYQFSLERINTLLEQAGREGNPNAFRNPVLIDYSSVLKGEVLDIHPGGLITLVMSQSIMLPIMVMMMVMFAIQMAATSIAIEKEQKTLETFMTLPVSRMTILMGKLSGSTIIAIAGSVSYLIGFGSYMTSAFSFVPEVSTMSLDSVNLGLTPVGLILVGVIIFATLVSALAMALNVAVFADNVRSAQSLTGILITPVLIPAVVLMFSDLDMLPNAVQWILLLIPYTHSIVATKAAFLGDYFVVMRSLVFIGAWTVAMLYIAAKVFSTERIITAQFSWGKLGEILTRRKTN